MNRFPVPEKIVRALPFILALAFFLQGLFGSLEKSLTWDEPVFIASGYTYLTRNDFRLNPEAPPLMQHLVALPLLGMDLKLPGRDHPDWQQGNHIRFARQVFRENAAQIRQIVFRARLPVLLLGAGLLLAVAFWGRRLYGPVPALVGTAAVAFSPNLLAHAKLATTDLGCTAFMFLSVCTFWHASRTGRTAHWVLCGLVTGLALLAKYTALLLIPTLLALSALLLRRNADWPALLRGLLLAAGVALLTVGAGYNLTFNPLLYLRGLQNLYATATPGYRFYLLGEVSDRPWWYYHFAAFLLKVPLPLLLLLALSLFSLLRDPHGRKAAVFLLVPALVILAASCFDRANLGLRRILPAFPFLLLFTAQTLSGSRDRIRPWLVALLLAWTGAEALRIYPHHLAYFNAAAGGPERGPYLLNDSNIDWGQDLPALAAWQRAHPEARPLRLRYFGTAPPAAYGVEAVSMPEQDILRPRPGAYAVSAHSLVSFRKLGRRTGLALDWLTRYRPVDRAGYSIYIYQFP